MEEYISLVNSKTKLNLLHQIVLKIENFLADNTQMIIDNSNENSDVAVLINVESILQDLQNVLAVEDTLSEMPYFEEFMEPVDDARNQLTSAVRILKASVNKLSLNYLSKTVRELLIVDAKFLMESVAKFLAALEVFEKRVLEKVCTNFQYKLFSLKTYLHTDEFNIKYKELTTCVQEFITVMDQILKDTISKQRQWLLCIHLMEFKRLFIIFYHIQLFALSCLDCKKKLLSWNYITHELKFKFEKILQIVQDKDIIDESKKEIGSFVNNIDQLLQILSSENPRIRDRNTEQLIHEILQHSMAVSHLLLDSQQNVKQMCQKLLQQYNLCKNIDENLHDTTKDQTISRQELNLENKILTDYIEVLERDVNVAILQLIGDKLPRIQTMFQTNMKLLSLQLSNEERVNIKAETLFQDFYEEADLVYQICRFAIACSTDFFTVNRILCIINCLENLDPEIIPIATTLLQDHRDTGVLYHLKIIKSQWQYYVNELINNIIKITDTTAFLRILKIQIEKECHKILKSPLQTSKNSEDIKYVTISSEFVILMISLNKEMLCNTENEEKVLQTIIYQLKTVNNAVMSANKLMKSDTVNEQTIKKFHRRLSILLHCINKACDFINQLNCAFSTQETSNQFSEQLTKFPDDFNELPLDLDSSRNGGLNNRNDKQNDAKSETLQIDITALLDNVQSLPSHFTNEYTNALTDKDLSMLISKIILNNSVQSTPECLRELQQRQVKNDKVKESIDFIQNNDCCETTFHLENVSSVTLASQATA